MKKYVTLSILSCFVVTSCIFREEIGNKCRPHEHPYQVEEIPEKVIEIEIE